MATGKVSLTLEPELVEEARATAGGRGLSEYINRALRHQLQRDRLSKYLADIEREQGPVDPDLLNEVREVWPAPESAKTDHRRSA